MDADFENTDEREPLDWKTRYEPDAQKQISGEAIYLGVLFFGTPVAIIALWLEGLRFGISPERYSTLCHYGYAWLAGTFGGTMFSIKWLYHAVARAYWNRDRRLWRIFCPHLSGGLAFAFFTLAVSGLVKMVDITTLQKPAAIVACSFLVGYFSDSAIGKLKEVADTLFGTHRELNERSRKKGHETKRESNAGKVEQPKPPAK